jgi:hypothetical protein
MLLAQRDVLQDLLHGAQVVPQTRARALDSIAQIESAAARSRLEQQIDNRRFCGARRLLWASRRTYPAKSKLVLALAAAMVSPRLLAWMVGARRRALAAERMRLGGPGAGSAP